MTLDWAAHQDFLKELWMTKGKSLAQVRSDMKRLRNFNASQNQYVAQFKKWGWRKNMSTAEWRFVDRQLSRRKGQGRQSEVYFNNVRVPNARIRKEIARHVSLASRLIHVPSPPNFQDIRIRSPPALISESTATVLEDHRQDPSFGDYMNVERSAKVHKASSSLLNIPQIHSTVGTLTIRDHTLPYFEFLNMFESRNIDESTLRGNFFDSCPSPSILSSAQSYCTGIDESDWMLDAYSGDRIFEALLRCPESRRVDRFYQSFANLLIPSGLEFGSQDQLDANKRLQQELPKILSNMPERYKGEQDSVIQTLLGPPQFSAARCLVEVVVYLYSNSLVDRWSPFHPNTVLQWIVETIPFEKLREILLQKLPTLQQFKSAVLLFAIEENNFNLVNGLLGLDTRLEDWICSPAGALQAAVAKGNTEVVSLILDIMPDGFFSFQIGGLGHSLLEKGFSTPVAELLTKAGVHLHLPVDVDLWQWFTPIFQTYPLIEAIRRGDFDLARFLINAGADVNAIPVVRTTSPLDQYPSYPMVTPLRASIAGGRIDLFYLLLNSGADVHQFCGWEAYCSLMDCDFNTDTDELFMDVTLTPLQAAAAAGSIEMVTALLHAGSNINDPAYGLLGQTALYAATRAEHLHIVKLLLQYDINIDAPGCNPTELPRTALLVAVESNNDAIVELLLNSGADPNALAFNYHGMTVLAAAKAQDSSSNIVSLLLKNGSEDNIKLDDRVRTRLMKIQLLYAIDKGDSDYIHHLLDLGVEIDLQPVSCIGLDPMFIPYDSTPLKEATLLHLAIASERVDWLLFLSLLEHVQEDILDEDYEHSLEPSLHHAVRWQRIDFAQALLDAGADVNALSPISKTQYQSYEYGPPTATPTALHIASIIGSVAMVSLLLDSGAVVDLRLPGAHTAMQLSFLGGQGKLSERLDIFEHFLSRGADINATPASEEGRTVLQSAVEMGSLGLVQRLLDLGADINAPAADHHGRTALQNASIDGEMDLVMLLLDHGADVNSPPAKHGGSTALQEAAREGHITIARLLLNRGADVNSPGSAINGHTALEWAASFGRLDMVQVLINAGADCNLPLEERYVSSLKLARSDSHFGVVSLLQKYRDEAVDEWNKTRVQEMSHDNNIEDDSESDESSEESDQDI